MHVFRPTLQLVGTVSLLDECLEGKIFVCSLFIILRISIRGRVKK